MDAINQKGDIDLTQAIVRELLDYDPATGALTWRRRDRRWFKDELQWKTWNTRFAGQPARSLNRYRRVSLFGQRYYAHRVIFLYMRGRWPTYQIDHENHDRSDNRWSNLFESTTLQNGHNLSLSKRNTSGRIGVRRSQTAGKFFANIYVDGRCLHLGTHSTFEEASAAREGAERQYGFHKNHGARFEYLEAGE